MGRVTLDLPDALLGEAQKAGILAPGAVAQLLYDELRRRQAGRELIGMMDRLQAATAGDAMTEEERRELVNQVVAEVRGKARGGGHAPRA